MIPYLSFNSIDNTGIKVEKFNTIESVPLHRHVFQEIVLITKGSCIHRLKETAMPLIPGDVFIIPPHQEHEYIVETPVSMYNCQFFPEEIPDWWEEQFDSLLSPPVSSESQNIIHLSVEDRELIHSMMDCLDREQKSQGFAFKQVKQDYLNLVLITISRAMMREFPPTSDGEKFQDQIVRIAQNYIEQNLTENIDFAQFAQNKNISLGYFRTAFKAKTGLPPLEYLNRLRIVNSIQFLKDSSISISDVAACVGIYDPNYFSRLFRKFIGYSPREFRKQGKNI